MNTMASSAARMEALQELARRGIRGAEVYLLDVLPMVEMAWADGEVQREERAFIYAFLEEHLERLNQEAGMQVLSRQRALRFLARFLDERPTPLEFAELRGLLKVVRLSSPLSGASNASRILEAVTWVGGVAPSPRQPLQDWDSTELECLWRLENDLKAEEPGLAAP